MKKILNVLVLMCLCVGLAGCGSSANEPWKDELEKILVDIEVDDVTKISDDRYEEGDTSANVTVITKSGKNLKTEMKSGSTENIWSVSKITHSTNGKLYYLAKSAYNYERYDIYSYKTDEVLKAGVKEEKKVETPTEEAVKTKSVQFIKNGYKEYQGSFRKDVNINGSTMYKHFYFGNNAKDSYFSVSDDEGNSTTYFYGAGRGGQGYCNFDYKTNAPMSGSTCNENDIENAKSIKDIFDKELVSLELTIDDLNK